MRIEEIANYVWSNSQVIEFGEEDAWNLDLFKSQWCNDKPFKSVWENSSAGWYWFLVNMSYTELHHIQKPQTLPDKGCNIGLLSHGNMEIFSSSLLCPHQSGSVVIYNGHEANVTGRIRSHFSLNNNKTGALGLKHYALSNKKWVVRFFSSPCFREISPADRAQIELLMNSYAGRCAVESAWRVNNGWPVLCKQ
jgi:hypothetical protein